MEGEGAVGGGGRDSERMLARTDVDHAHGSPLSLFVSTEDTFRRDGMNINLVEAITTLQRVMSSDDGVRGDGLEGDDPLGEKMAFVGLFSKAACHPWIEYAPFLSRFSSQLSPVSHAHASARMLSAITTIGRARTMDDESYRTIMSTAMACLRSERHNAHRRLALRLLASVGRVETPTTQRASSSSGLTRTSSTAAQGYHAISPQHILTSYIRDRDPRVRVVSLQGLHTLHYRGEKLSLSLYMLLMTALEDDDEDVRGAALVLMWILINIYPDRTDWDPSSSSSTSAASSSASSSSSPSSAVRLVDDGFMRICGLVTDLSMRVRALACNLLGSVRGVSTRLLLQTLSKKVFRADDDSIRSSHTSSITASVHGRSHSTRGGGRGGGGGGKLNPSGDVNLTKVMGGNGGGGGGVAMLKNAGVAGAFVHGLEDEYHEVRKCAVDSICELSSRSETFADMAVEFLVDMFNDEIDAVRLNAIVSLHKMGAHIQLNEQQLHVVLAVLEDASHKVRVAIHRLLGVISLCNVQCVHATVNALLGNMHRFPHDSESVLSALQCVGYHHPHFTEILVDDLLRLDPRFSPVEANVEDPIYQAILAVVLNASRLNPSILSLLPRYTFRHWRYLRDKSPAVFDPKFTQHVVDLVRPGEESGTRRIVASGGGGGGGADVDMVAGSSDRCSAHETFCTALLSIRRVNDLGCACRNILKGLATAKGDLLKVCHLDASATAKVQCWSDFIEAASLLTRIRATHGGGSGSGTSSLDSSNGSDWKGRVHHVEEAHMAGYGVSGGGDGASLPSRLLQLCYRMQHTYIGLGRGTILTLGVLRAFAHACIVLSMCSEDVGKTAAGGGGGSNSMSIVTNNVPQHMLDIWERVVSLHTRLCELRTQAHVASTSTAAASTTSAPSFLQKLPSDLHTLIHSSVYGIHTSLPWNERVRKIEMLLCDAVSNFTLSSSPPSSSSSSATTSSSAASSSSSSSSSSSISSPSAFWCSPSDSIKQLHVEIVASRNDDASKPAPFIPGVPIGIRIHGEATGFGHTPTRLYLRVVLPSRIVRFFPLKSRDFTFLGPFRYRLRTNVVVQLGDMKSCSEALGLQVDVVRAHEAEVPAVDLVACASIQSPSDDTSQSPMSIIPVSSSSTRYFRANWNKFGAATATVTPLTSVSTATVAALAAVALLKRNAENNKAGSNRKRKFAPLNAYANDKKHRKMEKTRNKQNGSYNKNPNDDNDDTNKMNMDNTNNYNNDNDNKNKNNDNSTNNIMNNTNDTVDKDGET